MRKLLPLGFALMPFLGFGAAAEVPLQGTFLATEACPAYRSFRDATNPGRVATVPGTSYPLVAKNKDDATHFRIEVAGADPLLRWVEARCGTIESSPGGTAQHPGPGGSGGQQEAPRQQEYVLAVSWQPAFCESHSRKIECETQSRDRFDAMNLALHGLWPQPVSNIYCDVPREWEDASKDRRWNQLPAVALEPATRAALDRVMPGTMSNLDRHEWVKHGTCFNGGSEEAYFTRTVALVDELNRSGVRDLLAENIGRRVGRAAIRQAFDAAFGPGAGDRVRFECDTDSGRNLIAEIQISLAGEIGASPSLRQLIAAAPRATIPDDGCRNAVFVDSIGLQ